MLSADGVDQSTHTNERFRTVTKVSKLICLVDDASLVEVHVIIHCRLELSVCQVGEGRSDREHRSDLYCTCSKGIDVLLLDGDTDGDACARGCGLVKDSSLTHTGLVQEERVGCPDPVVLGLNDDAVGIGPPALTA